MFYSVARKFCSGTSSLDLDQAQALALKYGPEAEITEEGSHTPIKASVLWPKLFTTTTGRWWCSDCKMNFDAEFSYENGFQIVRHECGAEVRRIVASVMDRGPSIRRDDGDPTTMPW